MYLPETLEEKFELRGDFEISNNFRPCTFSQKFQFPFLEESIKIIIVDIGVFLQKR